MTKPNVKILTPFSNYEFSDQWYQYSGADHFWMQWRLRMFIWLLNHLNIPLDKPLKGLEVGCGHGVLRQQIENETHWIIDGTDLDLDGLYKCQKGRGVLYRYDILEKREEFRKAYDFIIIFDVIEHIEHVGTFLDACQFHLKEKGWIFVNVPALPFLYSMYDKVVGHYKRYTKNMLRKTFSKDMFLIKDARYWGLTMIPLLMLRQIMTCLQTNPDRIIKNGFQPSNECIRTILTTLMRIELKFLKNPPLGTSLLSVIQKK